MSVDDRTAAGAATLVAGGTALAALPFVAVLVGVTPPAWSAFGRRVGRFVAAAGLVVVATWVARERDGPAGFTALVAAAGTLLLALLAGVLSATGVGAFGRRGAAAMALIAGGVCFLAVGLAAGDRRLPWLGERAATVVGLCSVVAGLFPFVRPLAFLGWAGWAAWLAVHLATGRGR